MITSKLIPSVGRIRDVPGETVNQCPALGYNKRIMSVREYRKRGAGICVLGLLFCWHGTALAQDTATSMGSSGNGPAVAEKARAPYLAYYAPFSIDWGFAMTPQRIVQSNGGSTLLRLTEADWKYILGKINANQVEGGRLNPLRMGLLVKRSDDDAPLLLLDENGGVQKEGEEFSIQPNALVRIFSYLERRRSEAERERRHGTLAERRAIPDAVTAQRVALAVWSGWYGTDTTAKSYQPARAVLRGGVWHVTATPRSVKASKRASASKKMPLQIELSPSDGRVLWTADAGLHTVAD